MDFPKLGVHVIIKVTVIIMKSFVNLRRDFKRATFVALFRSALNHTLIMNNSWIAEYHDRTRKDKSKMKYEELLLINKAESFNPSGSDSRWRV